MTTFNPDDPKYTAYVLGELSDADRAAIEAELQSDPAAAAVIEQIRSTADQLTAALGAEPLAELTADQRDTVLAAAEQSPAGLTPKRSKDRRVLWISALAASLLLAVGAGWLLRGLNTADQTRDTAFATSTGQSWYDPTNATSNSADWTRSNVLPPAKMLGHPGPGVDGPGPGVMLSGFHRGNSQNQDWDTASPNSLKLQFGWQKAQQSTGTEKSLGSDASATWNYQTPPSFEGVDPNQVAGVNPSDPMTVRGMTISGGTPSANRYNLSLAAKPDQQGIVVTGTNTYTGSTSVINGSITVSGKDDAYGVTSSSIADGSRESFAQLGTLSNSGTINVKGGGQHGTTLNLDAKPATGSLTLGGNQAVTMNGGTLKGTFGTLSAASTSGLNVGMKQSASRSSDIAPTNKLAVDGSLPAQSRPLGVPQTQAGIDSNQQSLRRMKLGDAQYRQYGTSGATHESELASLPQGRATTNGTSLFDLEANSTVPGLAEQQFNTEAYDHLADNPFLATTDNPLSTFSIDVDTGSYSNIRRFLMQHNQLPPPGAVRIEELVNYFRYDYPQPKDERPFSVTTEVASCPWQPGHRLVRIGLKGREIPKDKRPPSNVVFLIDVSGSMNQPNKLPLVQQSLKLLTEQLGENDQIAIVVYAGRAGLVLPTTTGDHRQAILEAIDRLRAGGSTNGAQGIQLAYEIASQNFIKDGVNRVILATDGDFNVGVTNQDALVRLIQENAKSGVFLTVLGFGYGNLKDSTMEKLADKGNGAYAYIDDLPEARKMLVEQLGSTLITIAKDVKIQIEFNPVAVAGYRLIGYEKRILAKEDFNNDTKDAGEIGAGHTVTTLYEIVPMPSADKATEQKPADQQEEESKTPAVDALKYVKPAELTDAAKSGELFTLKLRYKQPDGDKSTLMETPVKDSGQKYGQATADFKFAAAVAAFGMILRDSEYKGNATLGAVEELAKEAVDFKATAGDAKTETKTGDDSSYRAEFLQMVGKAKTLKGS